MKAPQVFITEKDEKMVKKYINWYEKTDANKVFFFPLVKGGVLILLYILSAFIFRNYSFGYWIIFLLGLVFSMSFAFGYLPLLGASLLNLKLNYFIEARRTVNQILDDLLKTKEFGLNEKYCFTKIRYSLGLLKEAELTLKEIISKDSVNAEYKSLMDEIQAQQKIIEENETKQKCSKDCCKG